MLVSDTGSGNASATDPVERFSSRPNFQALIYPHMLGCEPSAGHPPAFLMASYHDGEGGDDPKAAVGYALAELYLKFRSASVPAELHMYANVVNPTPHGHGLRPLRGGPCTSGRSDFCSGLRRHVCLGDDRCTRALAYDAVVANCSIMAPQIELEQPNSPKDRPRTLPPCRNCPHT